MLGVYLTEGVKGIAVMTSMYMLAEAIRLWCGGQLMMYLMRARPRTTINKLNKMYTKFHRNGTDTYGESIRNRAQAIRLMEKMRRKKK